MALHIRQYGDVLRKLHWNVLRTSYFNVLRTSVGDVLWRYIEDHMGTSIGRFLGTSPGRPWDVILPSGEMVFDPYLPSQHFNVGSTLFHGCGSTLK